MDKTDEIYYPPTVNEGYTVDHFNGNLHNPVKIKTIKTRQTRSDDSLGISVRTSEPAPEVVIENVENGIVRNYHFTVGDRDQVTTKKGKQNLSDLFVIGKGSLWSQPNDSWMYILYLSMFITISVKYRNSSIVFFHAYDMVCMNSNDNHRRANNTMAKMKSTIEQIMICKTVHRKLKFGKHEPHKKSG